MPGKGSEHSPKMTPEVVSTVVSALACLGHSLCLDATFGCSLPCADTACSLSLLGCEALTEVFLGKFNLGPFSKF